MFYFLVCSLVLAEIAYFTTTGHFLSMKEICLILSAGRLSFWEQGTHLGKIFQLLDFHRHMAGIGQMCPLTVTAPSSPLPPTPLTGLLPFPPSFPDVLPPGRSMLTQWFWDWGPVLSSLVADIPTGHSILSLLHPHLSSDSTYMVEVWIAVKGPALRQAGVSAVSP